MNEMPGQQWVQVPSSWDDGPLWLQPLCRLHPYTVQGPRAPSHSQCWHNLFLFSRPSSQQSVLSPTADKFLRGADTGKETEDWGGNQYISGLSKILSTPTFVVFYLIKNTVAKEKAEI